MRTLASMLFVTVCVLFAALPSWATVLPPGSGLQPGPGDPFVVGGTVVADTGVQNYSVTVGGLTLSGLYESQVWSDPLNSFCAGCLDFIYGVTSTGTDDIVTVSVSGFQGFLTDVGYATNFSVVTTGSDIAAGTISRVPTGSAINFGYTAITPGNATQVLVVETNATSFDMGNLSIIDNGTATGNTYQPTVPEPASLLLLGTVLAFVGRSLSKRFTA